MDNKKTKLTISGKPKKSLKPYETSKSQRKKTVVIDKQPLKHSFRANSNKLNSSKSSFTNFKRIWARC